MSYPPPPGAPQNPPQQPGYGPPPHMTPPPGSPAGGPGYPPADPYTAPPGDPYALPGASAPPAFGPPGHAVSPPGPPPPPPKKSKLGWILGGVVAVVVLVVAAGGAVVLFSGGDSQGSIQSGQTEEDSTDDSGDSDDGGETSDVDPNASQHTLEADFCDSLDYSQAKEVLDFDTPEGGHIDQGQVYCSTPDDDGDIVSVRAWENADGEEGLEMYESFMDEGAVLNTQPVEGEWDNGEIGIRELGGGLLTQSGNLVVQIDVYPPLDDEIDPEPTKEAVVALAEDAFGVTEV